MLTLCSIHTINTFYSCVFPVLLQVSNYIYNPGNVVTYLYTVTLAHEISNHNHCNPCNVMYTIWFNMIPSSDNFLLLYLAPKVSFFTTAACSKV